jgi:5'-nucleotidase
MDSVIVDWDGAFKERWIEKHPEDADLITNRKEFEFEKNFPPEKQKEIIEIMTSPGYYYSMKPFPGVIKALKEIVDAGYDVRICTAPDLRCAPSCAAEKFQWVNDNLGPEWMARLIITRDKTHVKGKLLVDDKPYVTGTGIPSWEHVRFSAPYNLSLTDRKRLSSWSEWREVLLDAMNQ